MKEDIAKLEKMKLEANSSSKFVPNFSINVNNAKPNASEIISAFNSNSSVFNLSECEDILKSNNILQGNETLNILTITFNPELNLSKKRINSIRQLQSNYSLPNHPKEIKSYQVMYSFISSQNKTVNTDGCKQSQMEIMIPINREFLSMDYPTLLDLQNHYDANFFNKSDPFFVDQCKGYINKETNLDMTPLVRQQYFQNISIDCVSEDTYQTNVKANNCKFDRINRAGLVVCKCDFNPNLEIKAKYSPDVIQAKLKTNLIIAKCYMRFFELEGVKTFAFITSIIMISLSIAYTIYAITSNVKEYISDNYSALSNNDCAYHLKDYDTNINNDEQESSDHIDRYNRYAREDPFGVGAPGNIKDKINISDDIDDIFNTNRNKNLNKKLNSDNNSNKLENKNDKKSNSNNRKTFNADNIFGKETKIDEMNFEADDYFKQSKGINNEEKDIKINYKSNQNEFEENYKTNSNLIPKISDNEMNKLNNRKSKLIDDETISKSEKSKFGEDKNSNDKILKNSIQINTNSSPMQDIISVKSKDNNSKSNRSKVDETNINLVPNMEKIDKISNKELDYENDFKKFDENGNGNPNLTSSERFEINEHDNKSIKTIQSQKNSTSSKKQEELGMNELNEDIVEHSDVKNLTSFHKNLKQTMTQLKLNHTQNNERSYKNNNNKESKQVKEYNEDIKQKNDNELQTIFPDYKKLNVDKIFQKEEDKFMKNHVKEEVLTLNNNKDVFKQNIQVQKDENQEENKNKNNQLWDDADVNQLFQDNGAIKIDLIDEQDINNFDNKYKNLELDIDEKIINNFVLINEKKGIKKVEDEEDDNIKTTKAFVVKYTEDNEDTERKRKDKENMLLIDNPKDFTLRDLYYSPVPYKITQDNRTTCMYFWETLKNNHILLNIFYFKSLIVPKLIRVFLLIDNMFIIMLSFAMLLEDQIITKRYKFYPGKSSISYVFVVLGLLLLSNIIAVCIRTLLFLIISAPVEISKKFNDKYVSKKLDLVEEGYKDFKSSMMIRFVIFYIFSFLIALGSMYYCTVFCNIYKTTSIVLVIGWGLANIIDFISFGMVHSVVLTATKYLAQSHPKNFFAKINAFFNYFSFV